MMVDKAPLVLKTCSACGQPFSTGNDESTIPGICEGCYTPHREMSQQEVRGPMKLKFYKEAGDWHLILAISVVSLHPENGKIRVLFTDGKSMLCTRVDVATSELHT